MPVLLVRHSDAVSGGGDIADASRWLSPKGRDKARSIGRALSTRNMVLDRILTSPRVRAVQTAELYAEMLGFSGAVEVLPALCFSHPAQTAAAQLESLGGTTAAFGHMPTIEEIAQLLCGGAPTPGFSTGEARMIDRRKVLWSLDSVAAGFSA